MSAPLSIPIVESVERCRQLEAEVAELRAALAGKSYSVSRMSHELRTPMNAVLGFSDLLLDGAAGELTGQQREFVSDIRNSGRHLLAVINDVLDLAKLEAGKMRVDRERVELELPVRQAEEMVRTLAAGKGIALATRVEGHALCWGDLQRLRQVALNLFSNAIKFTPPGGHVTATVRMCGGAAELAVQDTGVGIDPRYLPAVFEEFFQVPEAPGAPKQGTGLGLSLVKRFVEQMNGSVSVDSALGQGTTFFIRLEAAQDEEPLRAVPTPRQLSTAARLALIRARPRFEP